MPRKPKTAAADSAALPPISSERLDQLVTGPMTPSATEAVMRGFKKILIARPGGRDESSSGLLARLSQAERSQQSS